MFHNDIMMIGRGSGTSEHKEETSMEEERGCPHSPFPASDVLCALVSFS